MCPWYFRLYGTIDLTCLHTFLTMAKFINACMKSYNIIMSFMALYICSAKNVKNLEWVITKIQSANCTVKISYHMQKFHIAIWYAQPSYAPPPLHLTPPSSYFYSIAPGSTSKTAPAHYKFDELLIPTNALHNPISVTQPCCPVLLGRQIPPISPKLAKKTIERQYVDMAELCPEHLEAFITADEVHSKSSQSEPKEMSNILDWVQAFCIYVHS